jgi:hypothetical protein
MLNWKKLRKVIIPLIIVKFIFLIFFIFSSDIVSITREKHFSSEYQEGIDNDSIFIKKQKLIRIVRNEDERGISIKLRGRKNSRAQIEKEEDRPVQIID